MAGGSESNQNIHLQKTASPINTPLIGLVLANLLPFAGVIYFGWGLFAVVLFYWAENLVLGFYTLVKLLHHSPIGGLFSGAFFLLHYGGFTGIHGFFILTFMNEDLAQQIMPDSDSWPGPLVFMEILYRVVATALSQASPMMLLGVAGLFVSHGLSLLINYFGKGEYQSQDTRKLMGAPYQRIMILHFAVIAGGMLVMMMGSPVGLLVALTALKLGADIALHLRSHRKAQRYRAGSAAR